MIQFKPDPLLVQIDSETSSYLDIWIDIELDTAQFTQHVQGIIPSEFSTCLDDAVVGKDRQLACGKEDAPFLTAIGERLDLVELDAV